MKTFQIIVLNLALAATPVYGLRSLQLEYDQATPQGRYDKYMVLDPTEQYIGDLSVPPGHNVCIDGCGAVVIGQADMSAISVSGSNLDIHHCVILGGLNGIVVQDSGSATINNNTIYGAVLCGIKTMALAQNDPTSIWDNIIVNSRYGIYVLEENEPDYISFNTIFDIDSVRYAIFCPD